MSPSAKLTLASPLTAEGCSRYCSICLPTQQNSKGKASLEFKPKSSWSKTNLWTPTSNWKSQSWIRGSAWRKRRLNMYLTNFIETSAIRNSTHSALEWDFRSANKFAKAWVATSKYTRSLRQEANLCLRWKCSIVKLTNDTLRTIHSTVGDAICSCKIAMIAVKW